MLTIELVEVVFMKKPALSYVADGFGRCHSSKYLNPMIGDWLNDDTPVAEVGAFAEWIFFNLNLNGFRGDLQFVQNAHAQAILSRLQSAISILYAWRA